MHPDADSLNIASTSEKMSCLAADFESLETSCRQIIRDLSGPYTPFLVATGALVSLTGLIFIYLRWKRRNTLQRLERAGLPTVFWRPKFVNYRADDENQHSLQKKLAASTITNILPRMRRLQGPFGMYGTVYGLSTAVVHIADPVPAAAVLTKVKHSQTPPQQQQQTTANGRQSAKSNASGVTKAPAYNHFKNFCGDGVFTADGKDWRDKRAAVMHAILRSSSDGKSMEQAVEQEAHRTANLLIQEIDSVSSEQPVRLNIVPLLQRAAIGLIYRYITHTDVDGGKREGAAPAADENDTVSADHSMSSEDSAHPSVQAGKPHSTTPLLLSSYLQSITRIRMLILAQSRSIWFLLPRWCYRAFASMYRDEERTMGPIREFAKLACETAQPGSPLAILRDNPIYIGNPDATSVSKNLLDEAVTLLFAGQDTSAATLSWTLHLLSLYPTIQKKLVDQVRNVLGDDHPDMKEPFITKKLISSMPYLDAVIKESMRLYPVAPFVVRTLPFPVAISSRQDVDAKPLTVLPAGSIACIWIYGLHRNPQYWSRPDDFVPERWLDPDLRDKGITAGAYMPFAVGPRNCVGQPLATIMLRSLLARLVHRYDFQCDELVPGADPTPLRKDMQVGFTVLPKDGVTLSLHPYE